MARLTREEIGAMCDRNSEQDQIFLGQLVHNILDSEFGELFKRICEDVKVRTLEESRNNGKLNADRYLGRLESIDELQNSFGYMITKKNELMEIAKERARVKHRDEVEE